jgi:D-alanyl-D-alanine carboxypeptidase/D-alanyl-D-alanine-endopeptidase (penicillin-binding protein 4)
MESGQCTFLRRVELCLRSAALVLCSGFVLLAGCVTTSVRAPAGTEAGSELERLTSRPPLDRAIWGIDIEDQEGRVLYARNSDRLMIPASVRKLFASFTVEECTGVASTIDTEVWIDGPVRDHRLQGDVVIRGAGDPSLGGRYDGWTEARLTAVVDALRARGIEAIEGRVVADVSRFDRETIPGEWWNGDLGETYAAPVDALSFDENVAGVTIDTSSCPGIAVTIDPQYLPAATDLSCASTTLIRLASSASNSVMVSGSVEPAPTSVHLAFAVADGGLFAAQALDDLLRRNGIEISSAPVTSRSPAEEGEKIVTLTSPPTWALLSTILKNSQNLYAEMLLKRLAPGPGPASYADALEVERDTVVSAAQVDAADFRFVDGSGLATSNLVTPRAVVKILRAMEKKGNLFRVLMASPGEEGTLHHRLLDLPQLRGKTGTLSGVSALAGFVPGVDGRLRFFALMVNHATASSETIEKVLDAIVETIVVGPVAPQPAS